MKKTTPPKGQKKKFIIQLFNQGAVTLKVADAYREKGLALIVCAGRVVDIVEDIL